MKTQRVSSKLLLITFEIAPLETQFLWHNFVSVTAAAASWGSGIPASLPQCVLLSHL